MKLNNILIIAAVGVAGYLLLKSQKKTGLINTDYRVTGGYPSYTDTPQMTWADNSLIDKSNVVYL